MTTRYILRNILFLFVLFLDKLYEAIIKRKLQYSMGILNFTAPGPWPPGLLYFLYRINTSEVKNRLLF